VIVRERADGDAAGARLLARLADRRFDPLFTHVTGNPSDDAMSFGPRKMSSSPSSDRIASRLSSPRWISGAESVRPQTIGDAAPS